MTAVDPDGSADLRYALDVANSSLGSDSFSIPDAQWVTFEFGGLFEWNCFWSPPASSSVSPANKGPFLS